jgi:hypothetical protein
MATITTKAELQAAVENWLSRGTFAEFDQCLQLAEKALNRALLPVREREVAGAAFSASAVGDWLMSNAPDIYLFAVLVEAHLHARNSDDAQLWKSRLDAAIDDVAWTSAREDSKSPLSVDPALIFMRPFNIVTG